MNGAPDLLWLVEREQQQRQTNGPAIASLRASSRTQTFTLLSHMRNNREIDSLSYWLSNYFARFLPMPIDRRSFLQLLTSSAMAASFPASISRALEIPSHHRTGTIEDVEHIVIMMQENRSFDHYFGTLRGVRGFGDPSSDQLHTGNPVWYQPNGGSYVLPFHPCSPNLALQFLECLCDD